MNYTKLSLYTHFRHEQSLPLYKFSLLRGAFGWALKKAVCVNTAKECSLCLLQKTCLFPTVFSPESIQGDKQEGFAPPAPPPFILMPMDNGKTEFAQEEEFVFNLTLFGRACQYIPYFIHAITLMGDAGLGAKNEGKRGQFRLARVVHKNKEIYDKEDNILTSMPEADSISLPNWEEFKRKAEQKGEKKKFSLHCLSPLRFKSENALEQELNFEVFIRLLLRRMRFLSMHYSDEKIEVDTQFLFECAKNVIMQENKLVWTDINRYSNRQRTAMKLGGLQGYVDFYGDYELWRPWLELAQIVHLGKQTAFGYGAIAFLLKD